MSLVSVVLPVYNSEDYISQALESILDQTYSNLEILIINDGSNDETLSLLKGYTDKRIRIINNERNKGLIFSLNRGLCEVQGEYIARMDADDISLPTRIKEQVTFLELNPHIGVCGTWMESFGKVNSFHQLPVENDDIKLRMLFKCSFFHPTVMIRNSLLKINGVKYKENYKHAEDYKLWTDLYDKTGFYNLPKVLLKYRTHNENVSVKNKKEQIVNSEKIKQELLTFLCPRLTKKETEICRKAIEEKALAVSELKLLEHIIVELLKVNKEKELLSDRLLTVFLKQKYWLAHTNNTNSGLPVFNSYLRSALRKKNSPELLIKFFFKALLRYSKSENSEINPLIK